MLHDLHRAESVFSAALALPADQRDAYLEQACGGDPTLRQHVEGLLQTHEQAGDVLPRAVPATSGPDSQNVPRSQGIPRLERLLSCAAVPLGQRLKAFDEATGRAFKALADRFPKAQGYSVKLRHKNLPAFAPAYYISTLDRI